MHRAHPTSLFFVAITSITYLLLAALPRAGDAAETTSVGPPATRPAGEPVALAGKRLVFTNWHYIRPGTLSWHDESGERVGTGGSLDAQAAQMRRKDHPWGIHLKAQPAERRGPLIEPKHPWEAKGVLLETVLMDGGMYRSWALIPDEEHPLFTYLESQDGWHWTRPELGLVEFEGSKRNNLLPISRGGIYKDPNGPDSERYKWLWAKDITAEEFASFKVKHPDGWDWKGIRGNGQAHSIRGAVSPDGLHWTMLPEPLSVEFSDTDIRVYYDVPLGKYVMYTRNYLVSPRAAAAGPPPTDPEEAWAPPARRSIGRSESTTFHHFPASRTIIEPSPDMPPSDVYYNNCKTTIPGAPDLHLMFPTIYHLADDTSDIAIASSPDGQVWHFLPGSPVVGTGVFGQWDGGSVFSRPDLLELPDGSFALPFTTGLFPHKYPREQDRYNTGYAVWPKGRIVAVEAPERGEFTTVVFLAPGEKLLVNAITKRTGGIHVEAADAKGNVLAGRSFDECLPIVGDQYRTAVTWNNENPAAALPAGKPVMLRFRMEQAQLFSLDFE
jgi:hypothetical protein